MRDVVARMYYPEDKELGVYLYSTIPLWISN